MSCLKNRVLKLITLINGISFLYFGSLLDSYSWIPGIICCINFAWLTLFAYANGYTYKSEKGEEMEEIKEQRKTVCEFLTGDKRTEYIADITELVYNLISFTFQYGSINTLKKTIEDNHFDLFTFQYGSINTDYRKNR